MKFLREVPPGGEGLVVLRCDHWGYNSIGVVSGDEACVVDPGLTPGEIAAMTDALGDGGRRQAACDAQPRAQLEVARAEAAADARRFRLGLVQLAVLVAALVRVSAVREARRPARRA